MTVLLALAMIVALLVDRLFGEPPRCAHPVVGIGKLMTLFGRRLKNVPAAPALIGSALAWCLGALLIGALAALIETHLIVGIQPWLSTGRQLACALLIGLLLKPMLCLRMLRTEVAAVDAALSESLDAGRARMARLIGGDTSKLDAAAIRQAAIATLAEKLNDSVIAPLFWFAIAGLPGAAVYRFAKTAEAMWPRREDRQWAVAWPARAAGLLSWMPAGITGLALIGLRPQLLKPLWREARRIRLPNSGWPLAAMALRLDLRLDKPAFGSVNDAGALPDSAHLQAADKLALAAVCIGTILLGLAAWKLRE